MQCRLCAFLVGTETQNEDSCAPRIGKKWEGWEHESGVFRGSHMAGLQVSLSTGS